jgi:TrpR-related protein YerC/YecD
MSYQSRIRDEYTDTLFEAILLLTNLEECYRFFEDICTIKEIQSITQRLEVAKRLKDGSTYSEIEAATGASTATISRVNRCLNYGAGGYQLILERLEKKINPEEK